MSTPLYHHKNKCLQSTKCCAAGRILKRQKQISHMHAQAALPAALYPAAFLAGDLALAAGFGAFALASPMAVAAVVAAVALHKARK